MTDIINKSMILASRPVGKPTLDNFKLEDSAVKSPKEGEVLLEIKYLSLDPYMRGRMSASKSYAPPIELGQVMEGGTVARVLESRHPDYSKGDWVLSYSGWQKYALASGGDIQKLDPSLAPVTTALGVLGMPGFTAYSGLLTIGAPKPDETVVVAAASGPVGATVGQIARIKGARAVGIAGGAEKCALLRDLFKFDAAIDHTSQSFADDLKKACPNGIDVYYENVGGHVWDAVFPLLNQFGRVPVCGLIAQYNSSHEPFEGPDRFPIVMRDVLSKSLTIRGFIQHDFIAQRPDFYKDMPQWISEGRVAYKEDIVDRLEHAPQAFIGLLEGKNVGKLIIRL